MKQIVRIKNDLTEISTIVIESNGKAPMPHAEAFQKALELRRQEGGNPEGLDVSEVTDQELQRLMVASFARHAQIATHAYCCAIYYEVGYGDTFDAKIDIKNPDPDNFIASLCTSKDEPDHQILGDSIQLDNLGNYSFSIKDLYTGVTEDYMVSFTQEVSLKPSLYFTKPE